MNSGQCACADCPAGVSGQQSHPSYKNSHKHMNENVTLFSFLKYDFLNSPMCHGKIFLNMKEEEKEKEKTTLNVNRNQLNITIEPVTK